MQSMRIFFIFFAVQCLNINQVLAGKGYYPRNGVNYYLNDIRKNIEISNKNGQLQFRCKKELSNKRCKLKFLRLTDIVRHHHSIHIPPSYRNVVTREHIARTLRTRITKIIDPNKLQDKQSIEYVDCFEKLIAVQLIKNSEEVQFFCNTPGHGWYTTPTATAEHVFKFHKKEFASVLRIKERMQYHLEQYRQNQKNRKVKLIRCFGCDKQYPKEVMLFEHPRQCHIERIEQSAR